MHILTKKNIISAAHCSQAQSFLLVVDLGGTNCNIGLYAQPQEVLCVTYTYPTQQIEDITAFMADFGQLVTREYHRPLSRAVFAVAGAVGPGQYTARLTNAPIRVDTTALAQTLGLEARQVLLCNDFTPVALGYAFVAPQDIVAVHPVAERVHGQKVFIGAGTGLGVSGLVWNTPLGRYIPTVSEGGHSDFCPDNVFDLELAEFIKHSRALTSPASWEDVLSGSGIKTIYAFLATRRSYRDTPIAQEIQHHRFQPDYISRYAQSDAQCHDTFQLYVQYYARFAKNCALTYAATGGLYIAGGIAAKNKALFTDQQFMHHFLASEKQRTLLEKVPVYLIQDYSVSLYGAAEYARYFNP